MKVFVLFFCSIHRLSYDEKTRRKLDCLFSKNKKRLRGFSSFELNTAMNYHTLSREKPRFLPVGRGGAQVQRSTKLLDDDAGPTLTREGITTTKCILKKKRKLHTRVRAMALKWKALNTFLFAPLFSSSSSFLFFFLCVVTLPYCYNQWIILTQSELH